MDSILSAFIVAIALMWAALLVVRRLTPRRNEDQDRLVRLLGIFAPAAAAGAEPRTILAWHPIAQAARRLFPSEFAAIDQALGATFPFSADQIQAAHARWTTEWLAWELAHDAEFKLKAAAAAHELGDQVSTPYGRGRVEAIERERLERYQRRYEEYTRIGKALKALFDPGSVTAK